MPRLLDEPGEQAGGFPWLPGRTCAYNVMVITAEAVRAHMDQLREAEPDMPVEDRPADTWEPLIAVADLAGGDWPARARKAAPTPPLAPACSATSATCSGVPAPCTARRS